MSKPAIEISGLVKTFGDFRALDGLDLEVATGEVHGFLGPNGAGKSTTIRVLLGLLRATGGSARLLGGDPWHDAVALHRRLAYVPGDVNLWPNLSGGEAIDLLGTLRGGLDPARRADLLERFELDPTKKGRAYSKGNRQKVALVAALASDAELLVLDEPTSGLDPLKEAVFQACIEEARDGRADRAALEPHPRRGRGAVRPRDDHPRRQDGRDRHAVRAAPPHAHLDRGRDGAASPPASTQLPGVHDLHVEDHRARFDVDTSHLDETVRRLSGFGVRSLTSTPPTLEELFLRHYGDQIEDAPERRRSPNDGARRRAPAAVARAAARARADPGLPRAVRAARARDRGGERRRRTRPTPRASATRRPSRATRA